MKNNSIRNFLAALCFSSMSTGLLSMDESFAAQTKAIVFGENIISRQEEIHQRLDDVHATLTREQTQLVQNAVCFDHNDLMNNIAKSTAINSDIKAAMFSQSRLDYLLMQGYSIEDATDEVQRFINRSFDTKRPTTQTLLTIFSLSSSSAYNR